MTDTQRSESAQEPPTNPRLRLLPWTGEDGKPCLLGAGDGSPSLLSRLADLAEEVQLGMADELLDHMEVVAEGKVSAGEWEHLCMCLRWSLRDVKRVADSRGDRLAVLEDVDDADGELSRAARAVFDRAFTRTGRPVSPAASAGGES